MTNQQILDNAPDLKYRHGFLYYSCESEKYYELHDYFWYEVDDYTSTLTKAPEYYIRSLVDIKRIVELEEMVEHGLGPKDLERDL